MWYVQVHVLVGLHQRNCQIGSESIGVRTEAVLYEDGDEMAAPGKTSSQVIIIREGSLKQFGEG